jgi:hypothetical protein
MGIIPQPSLRDSIDTPAFPALKCRAILGDPSGAETQGKRREAHLRRSRIHRYPEEIRGKEEFSPAAIREHQL